MNVNFAISSIYSEEAILNKSLIVLWIVGPWPMAHGPFYWAMAMGLANSKACMDAGIQFCIVVQDVMWDKICIIL